MREDENDMLESLSIFIHSFIQDIYVQEIMQERVTMVSDER
jgi:hypothetical protein